MYGVKTQDKTETKAWLIQSSICRRHASELATCKLTQGESDNVNLNHASVQLVCRCVQVTASDVLSIIDRADRAYCVDESANWLPNTASSVGCKRCGPMAASIIIIIPSVEDTSATAALLTPLLLLRLLLPRAGGGSCRLVRVMGTMDSTGICMGEG